MEIMFVKLLYHNFEDNILSLFLLSKTIEIEIRRYKVRIPYECLIHALVP